MKPSTAGLNPFNNLSCPEADMVASVLP